MTPQFEEILQLMGALRRPLTHVRANQAEWKSAQELQGAIDRFAGVLTGDAEYFWTKPHSLIPANPSESEDS